MLDANLPGIPEEAYGSSNDAKAGLGTPSFWAASFPHDGQNRERTLSLHD